MAVLGTARTFDNSLVTMSISADIPGLIYLSGSRIIMYTLNLVTPCVTVPFSSNLIINPGYIFPSTASNLISTA